MSILSSIIDAILALVKPPLSRSALDSALSQKAAANPERLDWQNSIVDLMKLVGMDSSLAAREALAKELGYPGDASGSADMNIWLHQKVMENLSKRFTS